MKIEASRKQWIKFGVVLGLYLIFLLWLRRNHKSRLSFSKKRALIVVIRTKVKQIKILNGVTVRSVITKIPVCDYK